MREWLKRDLRRGVPKMVQAPDSCTNGTAGIELSTADDVYAERARLRRERDFWRCRCGQLLDAICIASSIADEWDEEA